MPTGIVVDEIDGIVFAVLQGRSGSGAAGKLDCSVCAHRPAGFEQRAGNVLRYQPLLVFPTLDVGARDGGLQVPPVMVFGVPGARRLMEAAEPEHGLGNELVAELQAFEVMFVRRDVVLAEYPEFVLREAEDDIGIEPGIVVPGAHLSGPVEGFSGQEYLELVRRVLMVSERPVRRTECQQCE